MFNIAQWFPKWRARPLGGALSNSKGGMENMLTTMNEGSNEYCHAGKPN